MKDKDRAISGSQFHDRFGRGESLTGLSTNMIPLDRIHLKRLKGISEMRPRDLGNVSLIARFSDSERFHSVIPPARYQYTR